MRDKIVDVIKECSIFAALDIEVCKKISTLFDHIELEQDDILFKQGEPSYYFYILATGSLFAMILTPNGSKFVGSIESGETVGELGAISGEVRTLTVKAAQKSKLLKLSSEEFTKICHQYPSIMLATIKPLISRSQINIKLLSNEKECNYVGVISNNNGKNIAKIKNNLLRNIPKNADYIFIFNSELKADLLLKTLAEYEKKYSTIIVMLDAGNTSLSKIVLEKAETIYILIDADSENEIDHFSKSIVYNNDYKKKLKFELVLFHNNGLAFPSNTNKWLEKELFFQHHHLKIDQDADYQRLLRFFSGNAVALVLGGGGARGALHLGVLKALLDAKIPIDAIGGTSIGSLVAASFLVAQQQYDVLLEMSQYLRQKSHPIFVPKNFTFPMISLLSGEAFTNSLKHLLNNMNIENLWQPYFCVTSNLSSYREHSHHSGSLFEKVRASTAIPGIFPPMVINGQLHYDGALCNNLPVDIMRNTVGVNGKIIAVGLTRYQEKNVEYKFPPILTLKDMIVRKLNFKKESYQFPRFFDTFYDVITFGSFTKEKENAAFADILINPDITNFSMLVLKKHQEAELIRIGMQELINSLDCWKYDENKGKLVKK